MGKRNRIIFCIIVNCIACTFCNAQAVPPVPNIIGASPSSYAIQTTKLVKTQGSNEYQNVHCGLQDKKGNYWFGTTGEGVYRYDGKFFTQFTVKNGLSNNKVWSLAEDSAGNIWFGTDDGISCYNGKNMSTMAPALPWAGNMVTMQVAGKNPVWSVMTDKHGTVWFGTDSGVVCYTGKALLHFPGKRAIANKTTLGLKNVQCIFEDKTGNLWFGSGPLAAEGICLFDGQSLTNYKPHGNGWIRTITADKNGSVLFSTRSAGVVAYNGKTYSDFQVPDAVRKEFINTILTDSKDNIWYGVDYSNSNKLDSGGCWKFDKRAFVEFTKKDGLHNTAIFCLMEDKAGNIWIGTRNCGLYRYYGQTFERFSE